MDRPSVLPIDQRRMRLLLKPRPRDAHKGDFGHVLVIGGDVGMAGAALMAAEAAARTGAGKVSVATQAEHVPAFITRRPEIMARGVTSPADLTELINNATVIVIGPGLGQGVWSSQLLKAALASALPMVVDADALNLIANGAEGVPEARENWVFTPHPGEAARLLKVSTGEIAEDRVKHAILLQQQYGGVAVLKGQGSLIATGQAIYRCKHGNPGMATGGMGDVLSGIIGGLVAQGLNLQDATCFGVDLHAKAADAAVQQSGERGLLATDLLVPLRALLNP